MNPDLERLLADLLASIDADNNRHGGLLSRETIRKTDTVRLLMSRLKAEQCHPLPEHPVPSDAAATLPLEHTP